MLLWRKTEALQLECFAGGGGGGGGEVCVCVCVCEKEQGCLGGKESLSTIQKYELEAQDDSFPPAMAKHKHEQQTLRS